MNKNKMIAALLAVIMVCTMLIVPATAAETENVVYTINLEAVDETTWQNAARHVCFWLTDGTVSKMFVEKNSDLGNAVVCDWPVYETVDGVTRKTNRTMGITYIPLRRCSNLLPGCNIEWISEDGGYALLTCGRGHIKLRAGAAYAEVVETGEQLGDTSAYTMPDGKTPAPIILARQGRLYVSARALANLVMEDPILKWSKTTLNISGNLIGNTDAKDWVGLSPILSEFGPSMGGAATLPHIAAAIEETNATVNGLGDYNYLTIRPEDAHTTNYIWVRHNVWEEDTTEIEIIGLGDYVGMPYDSETPGYLKVVKAILEDLISDPQDVAAIYNMVEDAQKNGTVYDKPLTLNTVYVEWRVNPNYGGNEDMIIRNK